MILGRSWGDFGEILMRFRGDNYSDSQRSSLDTRLVTHLTPNRHKVESLILTELFVGNTKS